MRLNRIHPCTQTGAEMIGLLLTLGLSLSTEPATAQEHPPPQDPMESLPQNILDEILVTATRTAQPSFTIPYSDAVISAKDFREQSYRSTPEALRDIPGVMVQKTSHGQGSPFIRGFTGFRNVFLIDGVRLNNSVMRDGPNQYWNTVDPFSLDRIEIIKGPSSVLYGSDAIGGTVAAFTLSPYSYGRGVHANGRTLYRYSSGERSNIARGEVSVGVDDRFGLLLGVTGKNFGDVRAGRPTGVQPNTGHAELDFDLKAEYFLNPNTRLILAHQRVRQPSVPRTHKTIFSKSFKGTTVGKELRRNLDQERELTYAQLRADDLDGPIRSMRLSLSWQLQKETRDRIKSSGARDLQGFDVGTIGFSGQFQSASPIGLFTYGVEFYHDSVNSFSTKNPIQGPVADDATYDLLGLYIQNEFEATQRLSGVVGGRFNYARADANSVKDPQTGGRISLSDSWSSFVGNARLLYKVVPEHLNLFAGVSQGFRAPNLSDLTRFDSARTNEFETPAPGLTPEHFLSYEIGVKARGAFGSITTSFFYTQLNDTIVRTPTGKVIEGENEVSKQNAGDGFVEGFEFGARLHPRRDWTLFGNLTWINGRVDTFPTATSGKVREPIDRLMPLTGQVGLRYEHPGGAFWVEGGARFAARADRLSTRDRADTSRIPPGGTPGYQVLSVRSGWRINPNTDVTLALENLTDENYRVHGSGQNEPGRSVALSLEFRF